MLYVDKEQSCDFHRVNSALPAEGPISAIGLMTWLINGLWGLWMAFRQQRTGAYMLWGGTLIVQICSYMALTSLMD